MAVCVDASVVIKWVIPEEDSEKALALLDRWKKEIIVAPVFMPVEVASVLRRKVLENKLTPEEAQEDLETISRLNIQLKSDWRDLFHAFRLAGELEQATIYDTCYLAVAEKL